MGTPRFFYFFYFKLVLSVSSLSSPPDHAEAETESPHSFVFSSSWHLFQSVRAVRHCPICPVTRLFVLQFLPKNIAIGLIVISNSSEKGCLAYFFKLIKLNWNYRLAFCHNAIIFLCLWAYFTLSWESWSLGFSFFVTLMYLGKLSVIF